MTDYSHETLLERKLKRRTKGLMTLFGYDYRTAYRAAVKEAIKDGDVIIVDGRLRDIQQSQTDGRIAG